MSLNLDLPGKDSPIALAPPRHTALPNGARRHGISTVIRYATRAPTSENWKELPSGRSRAVRSWPSGMGVPKVSRSARLRLPPGRGGGGRDGARRSLRQIHRVALPGRTVRTAGRLRRRRRGPGLRPRNRRPARRRRRPRSRRVSATTRGAKKTEEWKRTSHPYRDCDVSKPVAVAKGGGDYSAAGSRANRKSTMSSAAPGRPSNEFPMVVQGGFTAKPTTQNICAM